MADDVKAVKSEDFAIEIIELYKSLTTEKKEYVISKQILRSGTSIGANIAEAKCASSTADFISKLNISQKEASETLYWLRLLYRSQYIPRTKFEYLTNLCTELLNILSAIIVKMRN